MRALASSGAAPRSGRGGVGRVVQGHAGQRHAGAEAGRQQRLLDQAPADRLGQVGQGERGQRVPGERHPLGRAARRRAPRASSRNRPVGSCHSRSTSAGRRRRLAVGLAGQRPHDVGRAPRTAPAARRRAMRARVEAPAAVVVDEPGEQRRPCANGPHTWSNFGEASRPTRRAGSSHSRPSPSRSRCSAASVWCSAIRGSSRGSPTASDQAQASSGGWIVRGHQVAPRRATL